MHFACIAMLYCSSILSTMVIDGKSITIKNATIKGILSGRISKEKPQKDVLDQLYKETMLRLQIEKKVESLKQRVSKLEGEKEKTKDKSVKEYGFYAYVSRDLGNPGDGHTMVYDVARANFGNGYNTHTGIFTVPVAGLYSFTWVTRVKCRKSYTSELRVNREVVGSTFAYCGSDTVTGNVVVKVMKGDSVFVRTLTGIGMIRSNEYGRSSFSGFLIN